ncbi:TPA: ribonuclease Z, partial [Staphylococcus aureus]|nr:ribonuclease Z [Staphylococcus aureus]
MEDFKLEMLGFGSAFNSVEYGNTSGYFESDDSIYIIDCGSTVFNEILRRKLDLSKTI